MGSSPLFLQLASMIPKNVYLLTLCSTWGSLKELEYLHGVREVNNLSRIFLRQFYFKYLRREW